jgi:hypothetical protein
MAFIDEHRESFGVEPIREVLQVVPSAYWRHAGVAAPGSPVASS